jgi:hypothetical protein
MRTSFFRAAGVAALLLPAAAARGQASSGTLVVALAGASAADSSIRVHVAVSTLDSAARVVRSDSTAHQRMVWINQLPAGRYRVETRAIGFVPDTSFVEIGAGRTANISVDLNRIAALEGVTVTGSGKGHMAAFDKRRAAGKGTFLTREELEKSRRSQVAEVLRSVRGLRVDCGGGCRVRMVRATTCEPRYFINGFPSDAAILNTPLLDVAGIEIYRGPSETPGEFMGAQSMCGAIVVWTK